MENKKVLVVEDEAPLRNALIDVLKFKGFVVFGATNGEEGLAIALKERPDVILLDVVMPLMDGITMLKKLREDREYGASAVVIMLTNLSLFDEKVFKDVNSTQCEPALYLVKANWPIEDVAKKVKLVLAQNTEPMQASATKTSV